MRFAPAAGRPGTPRGTSAGARRSQSTAISTKQRIRTVRGFRPMKTAFATIRGIEVIRALRKGQARAYCLPGRHRWRGAERRASFGSGSCALTETIALVQDHLANAQSRGPLHEAPPRSARPPHVFVRFATEPARWCGNGCQGEKRGVWSSPVYVPRSGNAVTGAHSAWSHHSKRAMAPKTMDYELSDGRLDAPTASTPEGRAE